ncbi:MAG: DinB family protein [Gemmataceae bacterium]
MFANERHLYANLLDYAQRLAADIPEEKMAHQPAPDMNTPLWVLTHLAICTDYAAELLGGTKVCPESWHRDFGPFSKVGEHQGPVGTKAEILAALAAGHARVTELAKTPDSAAMAQANPFEFVRKPLPTVGLLLAHLLTTHEAIHLGQLSAWRRVQGMPSV